MRTRTSALAICDLGTILSIWAHPDDETYLAAGVMAVARDQGQRVVCVSATAGERGTSRPDDWPPERLGPVRELEAAAAMAVLGVSEHVVLGLPDGELSRHATSGVEAVARLLDEVEPDTVLTFGADGVTFHPDHVAVHRWVTEAWQLGGRRARLLYAATTVPHLARFGALYEQWGVYMGDRRPIGTALHDLVLHLELDGAALDRKWTALAAHASQTSGVMASVDPATFAALVAEEAFVDA